MKKTVIFFVVAVISYIAAITIKISFYNWEELLFMRLAFYVSLFISIVGGFLFLYYFVQQMLLFVKKIKNKSELIS